MTKKRQHIHKYHRIDIARKGRAPYWVMKCKDCPSYTPMKTRLSAPSLMGQNARCNNCSNEFTLNRRALRMAHPICDSCVKERPIDTGMDDFFDTLTPEGILEK